MKPYKHTLPEIQQVINLFHRNSLNYNLFKCEHIFDGENKNLDVLLKSNDDYATASLLLEKEWFRLYLGENVEKFKRMYVRFNDGNFIAIHLHREIAWHGINVLDKESIFANAQEIAPGIIVPSPEDSILIHTAHILFENFSIRKREAALLPLYLQHNLNWNYLKKSAADNYWEKGLQHIISRVKNHENVDKKKIVNKYIIRLLQKPSDVLYLGLKLMKLIFRKINLQQKGTLIALLGVNGTGKTTLAKKILEKYQPLTRFLGIKQKYYYYGWQPFSPLAKLGAKAFRKKDIFKKFSEENNNDAIPKLSIFKEALFIYNYIDYLLRYLFHIYPSLRAGNVVVSDRYFYDIYGQYPYARNSFFIKYLMRLFPQPDYTFILDASVESIMKREKHQEKRILKPQQYLQWQRERYHQFHSFLKKSIIINTEKTIDENMRNIINESWPGIVQKLKSEND